MLSHTAQKSTPTRSPFISGFESLNFMSKISPFSLQSLNRYRRSGQLKTTKVAGVRGVLRADWLEFISGTPDDQED